MSGFVPLKRAIGVDCGVLFAGLLCASSAAAADAPVLGPLMTARPASASDATPDCWRYRCIMCRTRHCRTISNSCASTFAINISPPAACAWRSKPIITAYARASRNGSNWNSTRIRHMRTAPHRMPASTIIGHTSCTVFPGSLRWRPATSCRCFSGMTARRSVSVSWSSHAGDGVVSGGDLVRKIGKIARCKVDGHSRPRFPRGRFLRPRHMGGAQPVGSGRMKIIAVSGNHHDYFGL